MWEIKLIEGAASCILGRDAVLVLINLADSIMDTSKRYVGD